MRPVMGRSLSRRARLFDTDGKPALPLTRSRRRKRPTTSSWVRRSCSRRATSADRCPLCRRPGPTCFRMKNRCPTDRARHPGGAERGPKRHRRLWRLADRFARSRRRVFARPSLPQSSTARPLRHSLALPVQSDGGQSLPGRPRHQREPRWARLDPSHEDLCRDWRIGIRSI